MLATLITVGSCGRGDPDRVRAQRARDPVGDDRLLLAVLVRAQQLLAEVVVDRRVGRAADRAGQRDRRGAQPLAADEQLGRGGDERARRRGRRRTRSRSRTPSAGPRTRRRRRAASARGRATSRASTIFSKAPARIRSTARATASIVVLGRRDRGDPEAPGGRGVEQRQRVGRAAPATRAAQPRDELARGRRRARPARPRSAGRPRRRDGRARPRARSARRRRSRPSAARRRRRGRTRSRRPPRARRRPGRGRRRPPPRRPARAMRPRRPRSARDRGLRAARSAPSAASAAPPRSGCSKQNQSSPSRREANTTALGSTGAVDPHGQADEHLPPWRRARRTARSQRAASSARSSKRRANGPRVPVTSVIRPKPTKRAPGLRCDGAHGSCRASLTPTS